jgi:hypothetical protein
LGSAPTAWPLVAQNHFAAQNQIKKTVSNREALQKINESALQWGTGSPNSASA